MRNVIIALQATEEDDLCFIVTPPGNEFQFGQLGAALAGIEASLSQAPTQDPVALEQIDYVRSLLGKSVLVTGQPEKRKGRMQ